ncbi:CbiX/SirB N-terminal domain-containing protein [Streptomyces sp. NPDC089919]|uniref:sirohydrochlorin chelatase n=1 Tax=Streptomyces sp. NPDC089919 TaxID=3155188 RepID=UPI0034135274
MLVIAVHGSAVPAAARTVERLVAAVEALSGVRPLVGHLDAQRPALAEVVAAHPGAVVVPLLLGDGYHRTVDIPAVLAGTGCTLTPGLSGEPDVTLALYGRLRDAERRAGALARADAVVVAGAGSSRPGGNDGTLAAAAGLAALLECDRGPTPVVPAYLTSAEPGVGAALAGLRAAGHDRIAIAAHLLADGRFTRSLAAAGAWTVTEPLAGHPRLARLVLRRYEAARAGGSPRAARLAC